MRGSLQEQLLKSGIATEAQLKKNSPQKTRSQKKPGSKQKKATHAPSKNPKNTSAEPTLGKALRAEIKQLLKANKLNDKAGEIPYNYVIGGQVKRFYINEKQQGELKAGKLVVVNWNTISYLISKEAELALRKLHPTIEVAAVDNGSQNPKTDHNKTPDDPYAEYKIPDDLTW